ncbi:P-loop containing nucleoside triphosphate hydrolase protein [Suillus paluster]|uniref:P-loop containing nucleoside triphosphate hydrolase protein n=1 Tax=Suillus paluster TaxID=48578 RepID=UPI001B868523|nr:P-loop containing nucleoside triphosphate hydrolase protein [Suillus paluster]KAG1740123.1 P-loop containing nucleoside triphosphate hydrolase protein [Suillus paluster]
MVFTSCGLTAFDPSAPCITCPLTPNPPQSAPVFPGSLCENIALGTIGKGKHIEDISRGEVEEACRVVMLESWVLGLDQSYETLLSGTDAEGIQLSGGQCQIFAIVRAQICDPDVLILDGATSALDPPTRALIMATICRWRQNCTTIIITHNIASIEEQDFVYIMWEGSVIKQGFQLDLLQADGEFAWMLHTGGLDIEDELPGYNAVAEILAVENDEEDELPVHE